MAVVIVFNIAVNDYIVANATGVDVIVPTLSMLDSFLITFGVSLGLGSQLPSKSTADYIEGYMKAAAEGSSFEVSGYGTVDFGSDASVKDYMQWSEQFYTPSFGLDKISYLNTGTSASKAIEDYIVSFNQVADVDDGAFDRMRQVAQYLIDTQVNIGSGNKPEPEKEPDFDLKNWWIACGGVLAACFGALGLIGDEFSVPDDSSFDDYFVNGESLGYYTGAYPSYSNTRDKSWSGYKNYLVVGTGVFKDDTVNGRDSYYLMKPDFSKPYMIYEDDGKLHFYRAVPSSNNIYSNLSVFVRLPHKFNVGEYTQFVYTAEATSYFTSSALSLPLFDSHEDAHDFYYNGDASGILNIDPDYASFLENVPNPYAELAKPLANIKPADLPELAPKLYPNPSGVPETIPKAIEIIEDVVPQPDPDPVPDPVPTPTPTPTPTPEPEPVPTPTPTPTPEPGKPTPEPDLSSKSFIDAILALLGILLMLLKIFLHLLEFIINIFKIPANPGFITGDFKLGFEYIKTVKLSPLNMSIYDFLMGLVHITIFFGVVKLLRQRIEKLQL